jgi:hypothetical protein
VFRREEVQVEGKSVTELEGESCTARKIEAVQEVRIPKAAKRCLG